MLKESQTIEHSYLQVAAFQDNQEECSPQNQGATGPEVPEGCSQIS